MNIRKSKKPLTRIILVLVVVLLVLAGVGWYAYSQSTAKNAALKQGDVDYGSATHEQQVAGTAIKENNTSDSSKTGSSGSETPPAPTPIAGSDKSEVEVVITGANKAAGNLIVSTYVSSVVSTGTCTLTLTKTGQTTITQTASVSPGPSTSSCDNFTVSTSQLTSGTWKATVSFDNDALTGSASQDVVI